MNNIILSSTAVVEAEGDKHRDTMVATIFGDGSHVPPFFIKSMTANSSYASGRRPKPGEKVVKGMTKEKMLEYADHLDRHVTIPTLLLLDRLSAHLNKEVQEKFASFTCANGSKKFTLDWFPPKTAFLISPCDMGLFACHKQYFYKLDRSTYPLKIFAAKQAWREVSEESVINFFDNCGLIGDWDPQALQQHLRRQVRGGIPEHLTEVWELYEGWLSGAFTIAGCKPPRRVTFEKPIQLPDGHLDGEYWNDY